MATRHSGSSKYASGRWLLVLLRPVGVAADGCGHLIGAEHLYFNAAILSAGGAVLSLVRRFVFAQPDHVNPVDRNVVLGDEVVDHGVGALAAQFLVILLRPGRIGIALDRDKE